MKVLLIVGSGDRLSRSLGLGRTIEKALQASGAKTELINLIEYGLPLFDRHVERTDTYDATTREFLAKSHAADAFVWVTPIYHNSFSAILKNALDWQHTKFPGKVVGLASHGGDRSPQALDQLMIIARAQHLLSSPVRVATQNTDYDDNFQLVDDDILSRVDQFSQALVELTKQITGSQTQAHVA